MHQSFPFIADFFHREKRAAVIVLFFYFLRTILLALEMVLIASLVNTILNLIQGDSSAVIQPTLLLLSFWGLKLGLRAMEQHVYARLKKQIFLSVSEEMILKKGSMSYQETEDQENKELIHRIGTEAATKFCEYYENERELISFFLIWQD